MAKQRTEGHTPLRQLRIPDDEWKPFGELVGDRERTSNVREHIRWKLRWPDAPAPQQAVDAICREILRVDKLRHAAQDQEGDAAFWARLQCDGEIIGLRKALCAVLGWPMDEAAKEGKADQYVEAWTADHPASDGPVRPGEEPTT